MRVESVYRYKKLANEVCGAGHHATRVPFLSKEGKRSFERGLRIKKFKN